VAKNKIDAALKIFTEVIDYARVNNHPRELSAAFINIASAFNNYGKKELALAYTDSAVNVLIKHPLDLELTKAYLGKTEILIDLKKFSEARKTLTIAFQIVQKNRQLRRQGLILLFTYIN
jgi:tetratricopeptide (TPR) repeat protein